MMELIPFGITFMILGYFLGKTVELIIKSYKEARRYGRLHL
jgi:hypothetical protein